MRTKTIVMIAGLALLASSARAWNCPSGQIRQQAPAGTPNTTPYYDVVEGIAFICVPAKPVTPPATDPQSQSQNQSQTNSQNSTQNTSNQNVSSSGSTSKSNSSSQSNNSSLNTNTNVNSLAPTLNATGGAATSSSSATNNSTGNTTEINSTSTYQEAKIPVNTAYAAAPYPTVPCFKGYGAGGQGASFGLSVNGGTVDSNCAILEVARSFDSVGERLAACKVKINNKYAKKAGVTLADCMTVATVVQQPMVAPRVPTPVIVNVAPPAISLQPEIIVTQPPIPVPTPVPAKPRVRRKVAAKLPCPTPAS